MRRRNNLRRGVFMTMAVFAAMIVLSFALIGSISRTSGEAEMALVQRSVRSAALTCYAVEGAYPADLQYLKDNYGLFYDESVYTVAYDAFASNIFPDIVVMEGGSGLR